MFKITAKEKALILARRKVVSEGYIQDEKKVRNIIEDMEEVKDKFLAAHLELENKQLLREAFDSDSAGKYFRDLKFGGKKLLVYLTSLNNIIEDMRQKLDS